MALCCRLAAPALALLLLGAAAVVAQDANPPVEKAAEPKPSEPGAGTLFHFGTSPSRTILVFESETSVETIHGITHKMSGTARLDFNAGTGSASFVVPVDSLQTGLEKRDEHLRSPNWLDAAKFPEIRFEATSLKRTKEAEEGKKETWAYEGKITIHGVTKDLKGEATVQKIPEALGKGLGPGAWVKVRAEFPVVLKEFDIVVPENAAAKVNPSWDVKVDIAGTTQAPKKE